MFIFERYAICKKRKMKHIAGTSGVQYVRKTAQYIPKFYIYTLNNYYY